MDFDPQEFEATALSVHLMPARKKTKLSSLLFIAQEAAQKRKRNSEIYTHKKNKTMQIEINMME